MTYKDYFMKITPQETWALSTAFLLGQILCLYILQKPPGLLDISFSTSVLIAVGVYQWLKK